MNLTLIHFQFQHNRIIKYFISLLAQPLPLKAIFGRMKILLVLIQVLCFQILEITPMGVLEK